MGRALGEGGKRGGNKKREILAVRNSLFFFPLLLTPRGWQLERLLRGPRPVTDRFPAPRSSTRTSSSIMPQHPPSPPSDSASTHSVGTDTDSGISACFASMMVNRPVLKKYKISQRASKGRRHHTHAHDCRQNAESRHHAHAHDCRQKAESRDRTRGGHPSTQTDSQVALTRTCTHAHIHTHTHTHIHILTEKKKKEREREREKGKMGEGGSPDCIVIVALLFIR